MNRDELELHQQHLDILEELSAAKDAHRAKPTDKSRERLQSAKLAARDFNQKWREVRDAFAGTPVGTAAPATVKAKTRKVN